MRQWHRRVFIPDKPPNPRISIVGDVAYVPLTQGKIAVIDADDVERVSRYKWQARKGKNGVWYAGRSEHRSGKQITVCLHSYVLNAPPGVRVDHINSDGLNNRRSNLREATRSQNQANSRKIGRKTSSPYKGVTWHRHRSGRGAWIAQIGLHGQRIHIGVYNSPEEAAHAYDAKAVELFGEYARLNFPEDGEQAA